MFDINSKSGGGMSEIAYILNRVFEFAIFTCKFVYSWPFKVFLFCCRETGLAGESGDLLEQRKLLSVVKKNIEALCRKVNQVVITYDLWPSIHCWKFFFDFEKIIFRISQLSWYLPFWPNKKSSKTKILINKNLLCLLEWKSHKKIVVLLKMVLKNIWSV